MSKSIKLQHVYAEGLIFLSDEAEDQTVHIQAPEAQIHIEAPTQFMQKVDLGPRAVIHEVDDRSGNELLTVPSDNTVQMASTSTFDFNNCDVANLAFQSGTTLDFDNVTIQNFNPPDSSLTTSQIASTNFPNNTLEHELDQIGPTANLARDRTQAPHHVADRVVVTNGSGIINSGAFAPSDVVRRTQAQNITGVKTFTAGPKIADDEAITFGTSTGPVIKSHNETLVFEPKNNQTNIEFRHHSQGANEDPESMLTIQDDRVRIHAPLEMDGTNDIFQNANSGNTGVFLRLNKLETQDLTISGNKTFSGTTNFTGAIQKDGSALGFDDLAGSIADSQITTVSASKVSGTLATSNIPALSATTAFNSGTVPDARLPTNIIRNNVDNQTISCNDLTISAGTSGDAVLTLEADLDNNNEGDTSFLTLKQDNGGTKVTMGLNGDNDLFLGSVTGFFNSGVILQTNANVKPIIFSVGLAERARVLSSGISLTANHTYQINGQQIGCGNLRANTLSEFTTGTLPTGRLPSDVLKLVGGSNPATESVIKIGTDGTQSYESLTDLQTTNASLLSSGTLPNARLSDNVLQRPGDANPSGTSVVTVSSNGTQAYALTSSFGTTNASNLSSGTLSTSLLPSDVIKKPSAANPASATSVITVDTSGNQAYATLDSLHDTAIQAVDQTTNNFNGLTSGKLFLAGPTATPGSATKPTFRTIVEGDLPSYLGESTLSNTFYTQTAANALLSAKQDASTSVNLPGNANPSVPSYVVVAANGTETYQAQADLVTTNLNDNPVIEGTSAAVFTLRVKNDNTLHAPVLKLQRQNADGSGSVSGNIIQHSDKLAISGNGGTEIHGTLFFNHNVEIGTTAGGGGSAALKFHSNASNMTTSRALFLNSSREVASASTLANLTNGLTGTLGDSFLSSNVVVKPGSANPSANSVVQIASDGTMSYITRASLVGDTGPTGPAGPTGPQGPAGSDASATTDAGDLSTGTLLTARLPSDVIKKPGAANPTSATSVITVSTNGTQAYATLDSLHDTAIQAVNQSTNNFDTVTHNHVLVGPAAQPFGGAQKPTFRALVEADLPSYLAESTLQSTFYTQTVADAIFASKAPLAGSMTRPTSNPQATSLVSRSSSGVAAYHTLSTFVQKPSGADPGATSVVQIASDGTLSYKAVSDFTNAANLSSGEVPLARLSLRVAVRPVALPNTDSVLTVPTNGVYNYKPISDFVTITGNQDVAGDKVFTDSIKSDIVKVERIQFFDADQSDSTTSPSIHDFNDSLIFDVLAGERYSFKVDNTIVGEINANGLNNFLHCNVKTGGQYRIAGTQVTSAILSNDSNIPKLNANLNHFENTDQNGCEFRFTSKNDFQGEPKWVIERRAATNPSTNALIQRLTVERSVSSNAWAFRNSHASGGFELCNNETDVLMSISDTGATINPVLTAAAGMTVSGGNLIQQTSPMRSATLGNVSAAGTLTSQGAFTANAGASVTGNMSVSGTFTSDGVLTASAGMTVEGGNLIQQTSPMRTATLGNVSAAGTLTSQGAFTANAGASVTGNMSVSGTFTNAGLAAQITTLKNKIDDLLEHMKGDTMGYAPGERAAINYFQSQYHGDSDDRLQNGSLATAGVLLCYDMFLRAGFKIQPGHIQYDTVDAQTSGNSVNTNNKLQAQSATFEQDFPIGRTAFQRSNTGTWDYDDDDDATDGYIIFDNLNNEPSLDDGHWFRFVVDTHRKRRAQNNAHYILNSKDIVWYLDVFKCPGFARWCIHADGGAVNFSTDDIDQDFASTDNAGVAGGKGFKVPFVCSQRYIVGWIIRENVNGTTTNGRIKFGFSHPNFFSQNSSTGYVYDAIDSSKQFTL